MSEYKVIFSNNKAVSAQKLSAYFPGEIVKAHRSGNRKMLDWLVVYGASENEAIKLANNIVADYWGSILN